MTDEFDYALVGGGLQNGLAALAIRAHQPSARIAMIERGAAPGGNHTWCFHAGDIGADMARWIDPIVATRWPGYDVSFVEHERRLDSPYACVTSELLAREVARALDVPGSALLANTTATAVRADSVDADGRTLRARAVIDARGPDQLSASDGGWQKFVGHELVLDRPHGLDRPMLMDARIPQRDGFRFMYVLPLASDRLLVEDTYFSDTTALDVAGVRAEIAAYARARGWSVARVEREETGVLPMPITVQPPSATAPLVAGYAGGWFHPTTAYSFPIAARLADRIGRALEVATLAQSHAAQLAFASRLNRMMFHWFSPENRHHVLARFYRLPPEVIARFYALELTTWDRARFFLGRPPRGMSLRAVFGGAR